MANINLKSVISRQIPEFVRSDYPLFVEFIEAYYEYLNQIESRSIESYRDIDQTLDSFIQYFKNELDQLGDQYEYIDQRLFLRKAKQLFVSKGSEAAYKFLFKILFNKDVQISYPWDSVLKPSAGKWNQDMSIFVDVSSGNVEDLSGNKIIIYGENALIQVFVARVQAYRNNIYEVFIDKNYYGDIKAGYTINYNGVTGTLVNTTLKPIVVRPGTGFKVGELIEGITVSGGANIRQLLKVTKVNNDGGIVKVTNITYGAGYESDFYLLKSNVNVNLIGSKIGITKNTTTQYEIPNDTYIDKYNEYGYILTPNYNEPDYGSITYSGTVLEQFYEETGIGENENTNFALLRFPLGAVAKYQGYYTSNDGFLDDNVYIQDSYYYQKYSYLLTVDEKLENYKSLIKSYIHPAGTALFGEYQIQNNYVAGISGVIELGQWRSRATFNRINSSIRNTYVLPKDSGGVIRYNPYDSENYFNVNEEYNPPERIYFSDGFLPSSTLDIQSIFLNGGQVDFNSLDLPLVDFENDIGIDNLLNLSGELPALEGDLLAQLGSEDLRFGSGTTELNA